MGIPTRRATRGSPLLLLATLTAGASPVSDALRQAAAERGHVLLAFASPTAPGSEALAAALPARMNEGLPTPVTVVGVDPYDGAEGTELARRLNVTKLPTLVLVDGAGAEVERSLAAPGEPRRLVSELLSGKGSLAHARRTAREKPEDPEAALALGRELLSRGDLEGSRPQLELAAKATEPALSSRARHGLALLALRRGAVEQSLAMLAALAQERPGSAAAAEAELARAQILVLQGDAQDASRALERFRLSHPGHPRDGEVAALLARLRDAPATARPAATPGAPGR